MTLLHQAAQKAVEALKLTISARTAPNEWDLGVFETAIEKCEVVLRQVESALQQQPEPEAPIGWLYDWTHSSALGKPDEQFTGFTTDEAHARKHDSPRAVYAAPPALQHQEVPSTAVIPPAPPECETEDEKTAFSFGYWQGLHAARKGQEVPREPVAVARPLTSEEEENAWNSITEQGCSCCTGAVRLFCRLNGITLSDAVLAASPSTTRQQEVGSGLSGVNAQRDVIEAAAKSAGLRLGLAVGDWYWRQDVKQLVRRNANGTDTVWNPIAGQALQRELQIMLASAQQHSDGTWVTGYTIKTGALHRIIGMMAGAGFPVSIPAAPSRPEQREAGNYWCNKCGYRGPEQVNHQRPNGSGECGYIARLAAAPSTPENAEKDDAGGVDVPAAPTVRQSSNQRDEKE